jgi:hypothetical protein
MEKLYELSFDSVTALEASMVRTYENAAGTLEISKEMNSLLMNLIFSNWTASRDRQKHYLFMALAHLDNVEKEIFISNVNEEMLILEKLFDKIRFLKRVLLDCIGQLTYQV